MLPFSDILILGVGDIGQKVHPEVFKYLSSKKINVEILPTVSLQVLDSQTWHKMRPKGLPYLFFYMGNMSFTLPKQSERSRSILEDGSRFLGLFWRFLRGPMVEWLEQLGYGAESHSKM